MQMKNRRLTVACRLEGFICISFCAVKGNIGVMEKDRKIYLLMVTKGRILDLTIDMVSWSLLIKPSEDLIKGI